MHLIILLKCGLDLQKELCYLPYESILRSFKDYLGSKLHGLVSAESQPSLC